MILVHVVVDWVRKRRSKSNKVVSPLPLLPGLGLSGVGAREGGRGVWVRMGYGLRAKG